MNATEPMSMEQAVDALVQQEEQPEEVVEESTSDVEAIQEPDEEQPEVDSEDDGDEIEDTADHGEDDSDDESDEVETEDDDDEIDESESEEPAESLYTVKVDGEEQQVTLDDLKQGYSGQKYVQKGMQQAAEQRKQAEEVYSMLLNERQSLAKLVDQVQQGALTPPVEPSQEMFESDPIGYMEAKMGYDKQLKAYEQSVSEVQQQLEAQTEAQQRAQEAYVRHEAEQLKQLVPELSDVKKAEAFKKNMAETAEHYGFSLENAMSSKEILALRDLWHYRQLQAKGDIVREKSKKARKPIKAGAKKIVSKKQVAQKQRDKLRKSGSIEDALALMLDPNLK